MSVERDKTIEIQKIANARHEKGKPFLSVVYDSDAYTQLSALLGDYLQRELASFVGLANIDFGFGANELATQAVVEQINLNNRQNTWLSLHEHIEKFFSLLLNDYSNNEKAIMSLQLSDEQINLFRQRHILLVLRDVSNRLGSDVVLHYFENPENEDAFDEYVFIEILSSNQFAEQQTMRSSPKESNIQQTANNTVDNKKGCYIATAVYGCYDAPQVIMLRRYRDERLSQNVLGRLFIEAYYTLSPPVARRLKSPLANSIIRRILDKFIMRIIEKELE